MRQILESVSDAVTGLRSADSGANRSPIPAETDH